MEWPKYNFFENPGWQTAAILNYLNHYLTRQSSSLAKILPDVRHDFQRTASVKVGTKSRISPLGAVFPNFVLWEYLGH